MPFSISWINETSEPACATVDLFPVRVCVLISEDLRSHRSCVLIKKCGCPCLCPFTATDESLGEFAQYKTRGVKTIFFCFVIYFTSQCRKKSSQ